LSFYSLLDTDNRRASTDDDIKASSVVSNPTPLAEKASIPKKMSKSQSAKKIDAAVAEWFSIFSEEEVIAVLTEFGTNEYNSDLLIAFLNGSFEKKVDDVNKTSALFTSLLIKDHITEDDINKW
jgi:hypothetical protein